jgi:hypothetical protein
VLKAKPLLCFYERWKTVRRLSTGSGTGLDYSILEGPTAMDAFIIDLQEEPQMVTSSSIAAIDVVMVVLGLTARALGPSSSQATEKSAPSDHFLYEPIVQGRRF